MTTSTTQQDYYPSGTYSPYQQTDNQIAVQSPPQYEVSRDSFENAGRYSVSTARNSTGGLLQKPVVVPQSTNIFMIKTFSPFARCYSPALAQLPKPIGQEEFLTFIDGLNESFLSAPVFQAIHVAGGMMMGAQGILPVQAVGAVLQIGGVAASAGVSFVRVRKYLKKQQAALFAPRGLVVKVMSTKQMMAAVGYTEAVKGKLQLPPLENTADIGAFGDVPATKPGPDGQVQLGPEDPRVRRLRALEAYVAPINFDVPEDTKPIGWAKRWSTAPLRWINKKQTTKIDKVREKSLKKRAEKAPEVEAENIKMQNELADLERRIQALKAQGASEDELAYLESQQLELMEAREKAIADIYKSGDKKLIKTYKKEEKIANRILWVVITRADGTSPDELFQVGSSSTQTTAT